MAIEPTTCVTIPRPAFFALLESYPTLVRGMLTGLTHRLMELPAVSRRTKRLIGPMRGLLVDG